MTKEFTTELNSIFYPESVAIVGASNHFNKWGSFVMSHMLSGGYQGRVLPINPKEKEIYGRKVYTKIGAVPERVDLAVITTPASTALDVVKQCIDKKVGGIVLITSGFSETGQEGRQIERDLIDLVTAARIPMVGPNTMGVMCTQKKLFALGAPLYPRRGDISFISQSGNLGNQMLEWAEEHSVGMSKFVGSGNEGVIRKDHYLEYFADDPDTKVILVYLRRPDPTPAPWRETAPYSPPPSGRPGSSRRVTPPTCSTTPWPWPTSRCPVGTGWVSSPSAAAGVSSPATRSSNRG
jgi:acyl-CoA synthetase (NDP forming)